MTDLEMLYPIFPIWKVSHGKYEITPEQSEWLDKHNYLSVHKTTLKSQGEAFQNSLSIGAVVNLSRSGDVAALVKVISDCTKLEDAPFDEGWLFKRYEIIKKIPKPKAYKDKFKRGWTPSYNGTIYQVPPKQYEEFEQYILTPFYDITLQGLKKLLFDKTSNEQVNCLSQDSTVMNISPLNQILYGPPGTGKTYKLQQLQSNYTNDNEIAGHEQWLFAKIENLSWMETIALILLDLGEATKVAQIIRHEFFQKKALINGRTIESLNATAWSSLQKFTISESETVHYKNRSEPAIFDKTPDSKWLIVEDKKALVSELISLHEEIKTGPSEVEPVKRYTSITFHQSYGYEEFIEGLRANSTEDGAISYSVEAGEFIKLCRRAEQDPTNQYAIFIDEINRGNISKIFGELITLIEVDKRAGCKHAMSVNLAYSGKSFSVPANVDIIGTMNTADRSLAMMDTALRRRFDFVEMMPKPSLLKDCVVRHDHVEINLSDLLITLNERIEILYDREHTLGHAFFMPVKKLVDANQQEKAFTALVSVFQNKIIPLLEEYFFEDWDKIRLVLADNQKEETLQFVSEKLLNNSKLSALFGNKHGLNQYGETQKQYILKNKSDDVWQNAQSYKDIYATSDKQGE